jgi:hypothetical protein
MERRPSHLSGRRLAPWWGRRASDYCEELRTHQAEFVETRHRTVGALAVTISLMIVLYATGDGVLATAFGTVPSAVLLVIFVGDEVMLRRNRRKLATDCAEVPELRRF